MFLKLKYNHITNLSTKSLIIILIKLTLLLLKI